MFIGSTKDLSIYKRSKRKKTVFIPILGKFWKLFNNTSYIVCNCSSPSVRFSCPGPGFWRDPTSCTAFYRCLTPYVVYRYLCPPGTRYDPRVHNCNHNFLAPPCNLADLEEDGDGPQLSFEIPSELAPNPAEEDGGAEDGQNYVVAADSIYPCPQPGYYSEETSCDNFYVCREVRPGVLSAQRIFRSDREQLPNINI